MCKFTAKNLGLFVDIRFNYVKNLKKKFRIKYVAFISHKYEHRKGELWHY